MKIVSAILDLFRATSSYEVWIDQGLPTDRKLTNITIMGTLHVASWNYIFCLGYCEKVW